MSKAQVIHRLGPPNVMQWEDWPVPDPGPGEVRLRHTAVGVNFADAYHRGGVSHPWPVDEPPMGVCAAYGHVSGPPDPVDIIQDLGRRGSLFITRPAIMHYVAKRSDLEWTARDLFKAIADGIVKPNINYEIALEDAVKAHQAIESGTTRGATVLIP